MQRSSSTSRSTEANTIGGAAALCGTAAMRSRSARRLRTATRLARSATHRSNHSHAPFPSACITHPLSILYINQSALSRYFCSIIEYFFLTF
nr:MAG TPA: hypothetical protein [Caudoviricetes sp.]